MTSRVAAGVHGRASSLWFQIERHSPLKERYECPVCDYHGAFISTKSTSFRLSRDVICPNCRSLPRDRLHILVLKELAKSCDLDSRRALHCAPELGLRKHLESMCRSYETADLSRADVDHRVDLRSLPFDDGSYDLVWASHILEHIREDLVAIGEIRRILAPGGMAILTVPIVVEKTIEYPEPREAGHVRAVGLDYLDRYRSVFSHVDVLSSADFPRKFQTYFNVTGVWPNHWIGKPSFLEESNSRFVWPNVVPLCFV